MIDCDRCSLQNVVLWHLTQNWMLSLIQYWGTVVTVSYVSAVWQIIVVMVPVAQSGNLMLLWLLLVS
jgi:hypothetical protein